MNELGFEVFRSKDVKTILKSLKTRHDVVSSFASETLMDICVEGSRIITLERARDLAFPSERENRDSGYNTSIESNFAREPISSDLPPSGILEISSTPVY